MKNRRFISGFAHAIVIVVAVFALVTSIGYVIWQRYSSTKSSNSSSATKKSNSSSKTADTNNSSENSSTDDDTTSYSDSTKTITTDDPGTASDVTFGTGMAIKYPTGWKLKHTVYKSVSTTADETSTQMDDKSIVSSPDGNVEVILDVNNLQLGMGTGDFNVALIEADTISSYSGVRFVNFAYRSIDADSSEDYYFQIGVQNDTAAIRSVKVGDSIGTANYDFMSGMWISGKGGDLHRSVSISFKGYENGTLSSLDKLTELTSTNNYKTAKQIVQSLYVKE